MWRPVCWAELCGEAANDIEHECGTAEDLEGLTWRSPFSTTRMSEAAKAACDDESEGGDGYGCKLSAFAAALLDGKLTDLVGASAEDLESRLPAAAAPAETKKRTKKKQKKQQQEEEEEAPEQQVAAMEAEEKRAARRQV